MMSAKIEHKILNFTIDIRSNLKLLVTPIVYLFILNIEHLWYQSKAKAMSNNVA